MQVAFNVDGGCHVVGIGGGAVGVGIAGRRVHLRPVVVAQRIIRCMMHVVCVVLMRDLFGGDVGDELLEMVVRISGCGRRGNSVLGGGSRGWHLLL